MTASVSLRHLDNLWFQVTGTLCNLACTHCFNESGPKVRTFEFLSIETVERELLAAQAVGVKEVFFTGGEPFLHPNLVGLLERSLQVAPTTVLTNGTILGQRTVDTLAHLVDASRYSLEIRVSLDGYTREANDALRGQGVFDKVMAGVARLSQRNLLPLVTIVRTWDEARELEVIEGFVRELKGAGYARPRLKILPCLPLGRAPHVEQPLITQDMLAAFDMDLLMCSNSRIVTSRGVWVCPLLVLFPDARLGATLQDARGEYPLRHPACYTCYQHGTICGNVSAAIES